MPAVSRRAANRLSHSAGRGALEARGFGRRTLPRVVPEPRTPPRRVGRRADRAESHAGRLMSGGARFDRKTHDFGRDEAPERCRLTEGELWYAPRACSRLGRPPRSMLPASRSVGERLAAALGHRARSTGGGSTLRGRWLTPTARHRAALSHDQLNSQPGWLVAGSGRRCGDQCGEPPGRAGAGERALRARRRNDIQTVGVHGSGRVAAVPRVATNRE